MIRKLSKCKQGSKLRVVEIKGKIDTNQFLNNIGIQIGDDITIISKLASTFIVNIKDGRFGIDENIAKLLLVEP